MQSHGTTSSPIHLFTFWYHTILIFLQFYKLLHNFEYFLILEHKLNYSECRFMQSLVNDVSHLM